MALVALVMLFALAMSVGYHGIATYRETHVTVQALSTAADAIRYGDEVLTMSARMAAFTGDRAWRARYDAQMPVLDAAIARAIDLFPPARGALQQTADANRRLIAFEMEAFAAVAAGDQPQARRILLSADYERDKAAYQAGLNHLTEAIESYRAEVERGLETGLRNTLGLVVVMLAIVVASLLKGLRMMAQRVALEAYIGEIGRRLLAPHGDSLDENIADVLRQTAERAGANHCYLLRRRHGVPENSDHAWVIAHAYPPGLRERSDFQLRRALLGTPGPDDAVVLDRVDGHWPIHTAQKEVLARVGISQLLGARVHHVGNSDFHFGLAANGQLRWSTEEMPLLRTIADIVTSAIEVTEKDAELQRLATVDALTGLANRRHFVDALVAEAGRIRRSHRTAALLLIDLDHFKQINDTHGHAAGDGALIRFAEVARRTLRDVDIIGRVGGEEFAALLPDTGGEEARQAAERLRVAIADAHTAAGDNLPAITVSIGIARLDEADNDPESAYRRADEALYVAKREGRNCVRRAES